MMPYLFYQKQRIHNLATTCKPFEYKIEYLAFPISNQTEKFDKHVISCSASNKASHKYNNYKTVSVTITTSAAHFPLFSIYLQSNLEHSSIYYVAKQTKELHLLFSFCKEEDEDCIWLPLPIIHITAVMYHM